MTDGFKSSTRDLVMRINASLKGTSVSTFSNQGHRPYQNHCSKHHSSTAPPNVGLVNPNQKVVRIPRDQHVGLLGCPSFFGPSALPKPTYKKETNVFFTLKISEIPQDRPYLFRELSVSWTVAIGLSTFHL